MNRELNLSLGKKMTIDFANGNSVSGELHYYQNGTWFVEVKESGKQHWFAETNVAKVSPFQPIQVEMLED